MARRVSERYDVFGQDTYTHPDEERHAADMGQPSTEPRFEHGPAPPPPPIPGLGRPETGSPQTAKVLCQTPVQCQGCGRQTIPFESVLVLVDGGWYHDGCVGDES